MIAYSIQHFWAKLLVEELKKNKISTICIAPGSRSTCLVKAISEDSSFQIMTHYDERSLGFFALGVAKASMMPTVVITTSGSAITNLIPAGVEALNLQIPLLFITADRPEELQNCGANQTLDQCSLLKPACSFQIHIDTPVENIEKIKKYLQNINEAITYSNEGPVHINMSFREPFFEEKKSYKTLFKEVKTIPKAPKINKCKSCDLNLILDELNPKKTLCIIANVRSEINIEETLSWAKKNNIPILAECTNAIRYRSQDVLGNVDEVIQYIINNDLLPDTLICIGSRWISKDIHKLILAVNNGILLHDFDSTQNWLQSNLHEFLNYDLKSKNVLPAITTNLDYFKQVNAINFKKPATNFKHLTLSRCFELLTDKLDQYHTLFIGNSLAVREFNEAFHLKNNHLNVFTQRGVSGIDGLISTGAGISFFQKKKVAVIVGDTSFLYDTNGLFFLNKQNVNVDVFVLNNNGGRIFEKLPIKKDPILSDFFVMPHNLEFKHISTQFNLAYLAINSVDQLKKLSLNTQNKSRIIEITLSN